MKKATLTGSTFQVRETLKAHGWKWDPEAKGFTMTSDWDNESQVIGEVRSYGGIRNRGKFAATLEEI